MEQNKLFTDESFDIFLRVSIKGQEDISKSLSSLNASDLECNVLVGIFNLIRSAALSSKHSPNVEDVFGNVSRVLFTHFNLDNLDKQGRLEGSIEEYIQKLKKYNYFIPNEIVELSENKDNLEKFEGIGYESYEGDLESVVDCFRNVLVSLRDERIEFWNKILEAYNEDKGGYDLEFRTKSTRHKKDLEWVSKIDFDDYVKRLKQVGKENKI